MSKKTKKILKYIYNFILYFFAAFGLWWFVWLTTILYELKKVS